MSYGLSLLPVLPYVVRWLVSVVQPFITRNVSQMTGKYLRYSPRSLISTLAGGITIVVPEQDRLEVTALITNQDIGFVGVGQPVTIKLDAFPYSRYGYVTGVVKSVSFDAIEDKVLGLVFSTVIGINQDYLMVNDQKVPFSAGMRVTAEIKTGERRVISYLLSPLKETISESMRER